MTPRRRYARHDNISVYMPLLLSNGLSITSIAVTCSNCAGRIPNDYVRGEVRGAFGGYRVKGISLCTDCDMYTYTSLLIEPTPGGWRVHAPASYPLKYPWPEDERGAHRLSPLARADDWWVTLMDRLYAA